nr:2-oxoacid:acceptor oxidoreductase family protein [Brachyspira hyodysenteriae]
MLAEVGVLSQGYYGAAFSSYGSEKKGSPVKSFVRFSEEEVRVNSTVEEHMLWQCST